MDTILRYSSSVYSNSFQLDDLLQKLSEQAWQHEIRTLHALEEENRELQREVSEIRELWGSFYTLMQEVANIYEQLSIIRSGVRQMTDKQKLKWLVNCTAF
jgi:hypothetical protein